MSRYQAGARMQVKLTIKSDAVTPDLKRRLRKVEDPTVALRKAGVAVVGLAVRAFTDDSVRPTAWAPLAAATLVKKAKMGRGSNPLIASGTLSKSPRVIAANKKFARVGSDRLAGSYSLAAIHQLGAPGANIPARPFFPFDARGKATDLAKKRVREQIEDWLAKM